jgi:hypothetical protein
MKDVTIPLFELEQRVEKLENNFATYQISAVEKLTEAVSVKFNLNMPTFLPKINKQLNDLVAFKESTELKNKTDADNKPEFDVGSGLDATELKSMKFLVNNMKTELDFQKKTFSVQKLQ